MCGVRPRTCGESVACLRASVVGSGCDTRGVASLDEVIGAARETHDATCVAARGCVAGRHVAAPR